MAGIKRCMSEYNGIFCINSLRYAFSEQPYYKYKSVVEKTGLVFDFLYILDGPFPEAEDRLNALKEKGESLKVVKLAKWFGESTALEKFYN